MLGQLVVCTVILDDAYGEDRDYLQSGGYSLIAETVDDLSDVQKIIDLDEHPCEWADRLGGDFLSALDLFSSGESLVSCFTGSVKSGYGGISSAHWVGFRIMEI